MKRILSLLCALTMIVCLVACGDTQNNTGSQISDKVSEVVDENLERANESKDLNIIDSTVAMVYSALKSVNQTSDIEKCLLIDAQGNIVAEGLSEELKKAIEQERPSDMTGVFTSEAARSACVYLNITGNEFSVYASNDGGDTVLKPSFTPDTEFRVTMSIK